MSFFFANYLVLTNTTFVLNWNIFQNIGITVDITWHADIYASIFLTTVSLIGGRVILFSHRYIKTEVFYFRFLIIIILFLISMFILIFRRDIIILILGWDGLGLVSYLLVIFFFSKKSQNARILTLLTNRLGDIFLLFAICLILMEGSWKFWIISLNAFSPSTFLSLIILLAAITKSAQLPFCAWLPAAIAAPTPVSALVHSSTLVTAGLYLLFRFSPAIINLSQSRIVFIIGTTTLILAGIRAIYETDIKKIVALSTLRQLGFIIARISLLFYLEAFIHLITHAFFKALLFITVGNIIHLSDDYQDLRKINFTSTNHSFTFTFIITANLRLRGFPFLRGFFSKELILESLTHQNRPLIPLTIIYLFFFGCILTAAYSTRFIISSSINWKLHKTIIFNQDRDTIVQKRILLLFFLAVFRGRYITWILGTNDIRFNTPFSIKLIILIILPIGATLGILTYTLFPFQNRTPLEWLIHNRYSILNTGKLTMPPHLSLLYPFYYIDILNLKLLLSHSQYWGLNRPNKIDNNYFNSFLKPIFILTVFHFYYCLLPKITLLITNF